MQAVCIQVGERFFCGFGRGGRIKTAWHLAGAKFFMWSKYTPDLDEVSEKLAKKGIVFNVRSVEMVGGI